MKGFGSRSAAFARNFVMDYTSIIAEFGSRYGLEDFIPDGNGAVGFEADGRPVIIRKPSDSEAAVVTVGLGSVAEAGETSVSRFVLQANQALMAQDGMALCLDSETNGYSLVCRIDISSIDFIDFDQKMATLLDRAEQWGELLEKLSAFASADDVGDLPDDGEAAEDFAESTHSSANGWDALRQLGGSQV